MKDATHQHVAVTGFNADNGKTIMVVVCINPPEAYASKDQKHAGFIRGGKLVPPEKDPPSISESEEKMILRSYFGLRALLTNLFESPVPIRGLPSPPNESAP